MLKQSLVALALFACATANASDWKKIISCKSGGSTLIVDRDEQNPVLIQLVIESDQAARYLAQAIQGNSETAPSSLHLYDGGRKLVISELLANESLHPQNPDPYLISLERRGSSEVLHWRGGSEIQPNESMVFEGCRLENAGARPGASGLR